MIDRYTLNGSAIVSVGTGTLGALETVGYSDNGVDIAVQENKAEILTDIFGPMTPQDFQDMGMTARIVVPFIAVDTSVLNKILDRGDRTSSGQVNTPGLVIGMAGYAFRLAIASPFWSPWSFSYCVVRPGFGTKLAVKANVFRMEFYAWPWATVATVAGKDTTLWTRSLS